MSHFDHIDYLEKGNPRQREAYRVLTENRVMEHLQPFSPLLAGTVPINIDLENSDLDIICYCKDSTTFMQTLIEQFGQYNQFQIREVLHQNQQTVIASFRIEPFEIEIFGQDTPVKQQNAYRHMIIEHKLLIEKGEDFRRQVVALKQQGYKTEPAFAFLLGLEGDPYFALLGLER